MTANAGGSPPLGAALAGIPGGIRATGPWTGRRQLFVKFARMGETATMYTADALRGELVRLVRRSTYHSIALSGGDPLADVEFIASALKGGAPLAVMLDHDGQRPESIDGIIDFLALVQVTLSGAEDDAAVARAMATLRRAKEKQVAHALVLTVEADASDGRLLRIVEQAEAASAETSVGGASRGRHVGRRQSSMDSLARAGRSAARRRSCARSAA